MQSPGVNSNGNTPSAAAAQTVFPTGVPYWFSIDWTDSQRNSGVFKTDDTSARLKIGFRGMYLNTNKPELHNSDKMRNSGLFRFLFFDLVQLCKINT